MADSPSHFCYFPRYFLIFGLSGGKLAWLSFLAFVGPGTVAASDTLTYLDRQDYTLGQRRLISICLLISRHHPFLRLAFSLSRYLRPRYRAFTRFSLFVISRLRYFVLISRINSGFRPLLVYKCAFPCPFVMFPGRTRPPSCCFDLL